tara:strand:+ start:21 stop:518 length:498 start_codon:yes stop_codon:yes gene_type:complete
MANKSSNFLFCIKILKNPSKANNFFGKIKWIIPFLVILLFSNLPLKAQETGPLLMKQELGYTLGGSVLGAGLGVIVWFMDPLNPSVTLKSTVQNGFVAGTALGALFGFYMLQNAIVIPQDSTLPENLDQLLSDEQSEKHIHNSIISKKTKDFTSSINFTIFEFKF